MYNNNMNICMIVCVLDNISHHSNANINVYFVVAISQPQKQTHTNLQTEQKKE